MWQRKLLLLFRKLFADVGGDPDNFELALSQLDLDGNQRISFEEFLRWLNWVSFDDFL